MLIVLACFIYFEAVTQILPGDVGVPEKQLPQPTGCHPEGIEDSLKDLGFFAYSSE